MQANMISEIVELTVDPLPVARLIRTPIENNNAGKDKTCATNSSIVVTNVTDRLLTTKLSYAFMLRCSECGSRQNM